MPKSKERSNKINENKEKLPKFKGVRKAASAPFPEEGVLKADVIIIGGGSGIPAAIEAAQAGAFPPGWFSGNNRSVTAGECGGKYYVARFRRHAYGAGNDVNAIYGDTYPFVLSGNTSSFAINTGRIAGQQAASFVSKFKW